MNRLASALTALLLVPCAANADLPAHQPAYLQAVTDLRTARWLLERRPGDATVGRQEDVAFMEIDAAIGDIKDAASGGGKDFHYHPNIDVPRNRPSRLSVVLELLRKVQADVAREADDSMTPGVRERAMGHIDAATHATEDVFSAVEYGG
jgi:hypothetical protein